MRIFDLNTVDQADDGAILSVMLHTILSPPLLEYLGHGHVYKLASDIPRWTRWQAMPAREKKEQKKGYEDSRLEHWHCTGERLTRSIN
jgi:hypothetical protein